MSTRALGVAVGTWGLREGEPLPRAGLAPCALRAKARELLTRIFLGHWHLVRNSNIANDSIWMVGVFPSWGEGRGLPRSG